MRAHAFGKPESLNDLWALSPNALFNCDRIKPRYALQAMLFDPRLITVRILGKARKTNCLTDEFGNTHPRLLR